MVTKENSEGKTLS